MPFDLQKAAYGKSSVSKLDTVRPVALSDIQSNQKNFYELDAIEALMGSIQLVGLLDPVLLLRTASGYRIISGHRRVEAYTRLAAEGNGDYERIPARVIEGMDDLTEYAALIIANSTARELNYQTKLKQEQELRSTLLAMKEAGREIPSNLSQYIAEQIGVSRNEVSRMHSVNSNLIPEARAKVDAGEMTAQQAYEMSRKTETEQAAELAGETSPEVPELVIAQNMRHIFPRIRDYLCMPRSEAIAEIKLQLNNTGFGYGDISFFGKSAGLEINHANASVLLKWSDVHDRAVQIMAREQKMAGTIKWNTGKPDNPGDYACVIRLDNRDHPLRQILHWDGTSWSFGQTKTKVDVSIRIEGWVQIPEEDPS